MIRLPLSVVSPAGPYGRLSVLIFHRVLARADPLMPDVPDAARFEREMGWIARWFNVLPLEDAVRRLYDGTIPARALAITFDDGYSDNEEVAAPILHKLGLHATFFVSTGFLDGGCMWNDRVIGAVRSCREPILDLRAAGLGAHDIADDARRRTAIHALLKEIKHREPAARQAAVDAVVRASSVDGSPNEMMTAAQVRRLAAGGMAIGAHTVMHPILTRLEPQAAQAEIVEGKRRLEEILGAAGSVRLFAYPNGVPGQDYDITHVKMVRDAGFVAAVSTAWGAASRRSDPYQLPRFTPWDRSSLRYGVRMVANVRRTEAVAV